MFSLRYLIPAFFGALCLFTTVTYAGEQNILTLAAAVADALKANPNLAQIKARADAMAAIPSQAGALPDPVISFNALNLPADSFDTRQEAMTQMQVGLSQTIPFPGKLALKAEAATFDANAALKSVDEAKLWLQSQVKTGWWQLFYLDRALEIVENNQTLLRQFIQIARAKYEVGEGLQQDVLLAQLELSRLLEQQITLQGLRRNSSAQLNALLNQPTTRPLTLPSRVALSLPTLVNENNLLEQAEQSRAVLNAKRDLVNAAQSRLDLAKKDYYPDLNVGVAYSGRDNTLTGVDRADFVSFKLSANLPIFFNDKQDKAVDQKTSEWLQQKYALQDEINRVHTQISQHYSDFVRSKQQFILFKDGIIPQARQTVSSMLAGYQVSKVDFLNLVRSQITLFNYEMQYWQVFAEANQALAQLLAAVGKEEIYE